MGRLKDLTGQRFGRLTVIERADTKGKRTMWLCKCDCGREKSIGSHNLLTGNTSSCGCLWKETVPSYNKENNTRHGDSHTKLHKAWLNMRYRCFNKRCKFYDNYGGRGITICEEWSVYENFRDWALANGFANGLSIDRIDVDGNYCPENCRWVSEKVQQNNRRVNNYLTLNGTRHTIQEWSEITGIGWTTINERLKNGWTVEKALTKKPGKYKRKEVT